MKLLSSSPSSSIFRLEITFITLQAQWEVTPLIHLESCYYQLSCHPLLQNLEFDFLLVLTICDALHVCCVQNVTCMVWIISQLLLHLFFAWVGYRPGHVNPCQHQKDKYVVHLWWGYTRCFTLQGSPPYQVNTTLPYLSRDSVTMSLKLNPQVNVSLNV